MSVRGIRKSDRLPNRVHVRIHLLRAGTEREALCGGLPVHVGACEHCENSWRIGTEATAFDRRDAIEPYACGVGVVPLPAHGYTRVHLHRHDANGWPICGASRYRFVTCSLCLRMVEVHIRAPWATQIATGGTISVCGKPMTYVSSDAVEPPDLLHGLPFDRWIDVSEAHSWAECDSIDLWRLCRSCETGLARYDASQVALHERAARKAEMQQAIATQREVLGLSREARLASNRRLASELGLPSGGSRKRPKRQLVGSAVVDSTASDLARRDAEAMRTRSLEVLYDNGDDDD